MLQEFVDLVEPVDTLLATAEKRYETTNPRSYRMKPPLRKKLLSTMTATRDVDLPMDLGIGLVGTMIIVLCYQPHNRTQEENFEEATRVITISVGIDPLSERTTRITTITDTRITKQDHLTNQTKTNPGIGEVTATIHDRLQPHDKIHLLRVPAGNPNSTRLIVQC